MICRVKPNKNLEPFTTSNAPLRLALGIIFKVIKMLDDRAFLKLTNYLEKVPAIEGSIGFGSNDDTTWWVKFTINLSHEFAWHTVQELGHVLNYLSLHERLPTAFYPVSPPPYVNGGPHDFLSWVIECEDSTMRPGTVAEWLTGRLPRPVEDENEWRMVDDDT